MYFQHYVKVLFYLKSGKSKQQCMHLLFSFTTITTLDSCLYDAAHELLVIIAVSDYPREHWLLAFT